MAAEMPDPAFQEFPEEHVFLESVVGDLATAIVFESKLGYRWRWYWEQRNRESDELFERSDLPFSEVLRLLDREHWPKALAVHLDALKISFAQREQLERHPPEEVSTELLAGAMTISRNVEALAKELGQATRLRMWTTEWDEDDGWS